MTTEKKTLEITLSDRAPVRVDPSAWPIIASASRHDGAVVCQASNEWTIKIREHADGRRLVYGMHEAGNGGQYAGFRPTHGGFLVGSDEMEEATVRAIRRVAGLIGDTQLGDECIADLPATEL